jgi:putative N6-adenine-specific DNA methylase
MSRLLSRVLAPLKTFECRDTDELYKNVKKIKWEQFLSQKSTFAVVANVSNSGITHSKFAAYRVKDAIVDYFSDRTGKRPGVDTDDPDLVINLHVKDDTADISIDASGGALHRRGYREETVSAPMQETVAAAMIRLSGWDGTTRLHDPMCGSGTILCEALMHRSRFRDHGNPQRTSFRRRPVRRGGECIKNQPDGASLRQPGGN